MTKEFDSELRNDAMAIWLAAVDAVRSDFLVERNVHCTSDELHIGGQIIPLDEAGRIEVVGCGKAGTGMARGLLAALEPVRRRVTVSGWINVPEDCVEVLDGIHLHPARPAGINEPTDAGVNGTQEILKRLGSLTSSDLCIVLISGGGSALLPAPIPEITLEDKLAVTRLLSSQGASIDQLNIVRSQLSLVKGGGLLRHCRAGRLITLVISDVIGDPLDIIASGPTTLTDRTANHALDVLKTYDPTGSLIPDRVYIALKNAKPKRNEPTCSVQNIIVGSNAVALAAAETEARSRGYDVHRLGSDNCGEAAEHGRKLLSQLRELQSSQSPDRRPVCLLAGGETTVQLSTTTKPRRGGRNQEVVLAAVSASPKVSDWNGLALLSGGTDGEDGPTDAAGAIANTELVAKMHAAGINPADYLAINNSYDFFEQLNGLLTTGPTHTNVMDVAVGLAVKRK